MAGTTFLLTIYGRYVGVAREEWRRLHEVMDSFNVSYLQLVPRLGLSAGRNALVEACRTKYLVLLDDDVFFTASTRLDLLLQRLEDDPSLQLVAGAYSQYSAATAAAVVEDYSLRFAPNATQRGVYIWRSPRSRLTYDLGDFRRL